MSCSMFEHVYHDGMPFLGQVLDKESLGVVSISLDLLSPKLTPRYLFQKTSRPE